MDAYTTLQDENSKSAPLVEPTQHSQQFEQEQHEGSSIIMIQNESLIIESSDSDINKKGVSLLHK